MHGAPLGDHGVRPRSGKAPAGAGRVDVMAEFYVRVKPTAESIATAAQTLGQKTMSPNELKELVEGKFVDALRAVAAEMAMEELHEKRVDFVQKVQQVVSEDLFKNGLELETVSLTGLDQTSFNFFNPQNAFDAEGLTKLTQTIEDRRKIRNDIEQETDLAIKTKNLEAERSRLQILREEEYAKMQQEREISVRKAEQLAEIATQEAAKKREAEEAQIAADREVELKRILTARDLENENIQKEQLIERAKVEQRKTVELAEQDRAIAVAEKSRAESEAKALADKARAEAVKAEEEVVTVRETQRAERVKAVELVNAAQEAQKEALALTVAAEAEKQAALDKAEAVRIAAEAEAEKHRLQAKGEADAKVLLAQAQEQQYKVDAEGTRAVNEAANVLSLEQVEMQVRMALLRHLPDIIRESVKPMENIDDIKISNFKTDNIENLTKLIIDFMTLTFVKTDNRIEKSMLIIKTKNFDTNNDNFTSVLKAELERNCKSFQTTPTFLYLKHKDNVGFYHKHYSNYADK